MKRRLLILLTIFLTACGPAPQSGPSMKLPEGKPRPVEVTFASPLREIDSLDDAATIMVGFNQPMTMLQPIPVDKSTGPLYLEPSVPGKFRWKGTATLVFIPDKPLPYATKFKGTVPAQTPSLNGQVLAKDYTFEFETPRPRMVKSEPADDSKWQPLDPVCLLLFNQPMDPARLAGQFEFKTFPEEGKSNATIDGTVRAPDAKELERFFGPEPTDETREQFSRLVAVLPQKPLETGRSYGLNLKKGMVGTGGPLGSNDEQTIVFSTINKFESTALDENGKKDLRPDESLTFQFSNPVTYAELAKNITFEPAVKMSEGYLEDSDYSSDSLYLYLQMQPRTAYKVHLGADLKDQFGNKLGKAVDYSFKTGDYAPGIRMPEGTAVLETATPEPRIPIGMLNVQKATLNVWPLNADQVVKAAQDIGEFKPPANKITVNLEPNDKPNVMQDRYYKVESALGGKKSGWLYLELGHDKNDYPRHLLVQVTNLGLTAKFSPENTVGWVTALDTGKPVAGATVELRDESNKLLDTATSGPDGTVSFRGWSTYGLKQENRWSQPQMFLFARSGPDVAMIGNNYSWNIDPWTFNLDYDYSPELPTRVGMAFTERGLYRAGDEVYVKGALREINNGRYQMSELKQLDYKLLDSRDQLVSMGVVDLGNFGSFDQTLKLPRSAATGWYSLYYYQPGDARKSLKNENLAPLFSESFRVEAFRPAQFEVKVDVSEPSYGYGDKLKSEILGRYLFGGLMKGDALEWTVRAAPTSWQPPGWDGYDFETSSWLQDDDAKPEEAKILSSGKGQLDAEGKKKLEVDLALKYRGSAAITVEGTVTSASRQQISGRATVMAHPGSFLIGLRPKSMFLTAGSPAPLDVVTVKSDGKADAGRKVNLELFRRQWNSVRRAGTGGGYEWVVTHTDEKVGEPVVVTTGDAAVPASVKPDKSGFYVVKATSQDEKGRKIESWTSFYAEGTEYVAWARGENDSVELVPDKKSYKPGDTAHILVKSPYESCQALVTVERELVMRRFVVELKGSTPTVEVPIKSEDLPNAFISVVLVSGRIPDKGQDDSGEDLGKPSFRLGYVNLPVDTGERHLTVTVKTDKEEYQPRQTVTIDLELKDSQGRPVQGEVDVAVVDRGVLNLIDYQTPDFFGPFYGPRSLRVRTAELRRDVIGMRSYGTKGDPSGGGGGESSGETREDFKATPFWNPTVLTDAQGKAQLTFTLPDSLTSFRVMATALTKSSEFGAGESEFRVNKPLQMLPSVPRFVRVHDTFKAGVLVSNNTKQSGSVEVRVQAEGVDLTGQPSTTVNVAAGDQKEVLFDFAAKKPGQGSLVFQASMGADKDGLRLPLPVQVPLATETVATTGDFTEGVHKEVLDLQSKPAPGVGGLTVTLSSSLLSGLEGALSYLETYPYGCLEQRLSKMAPQIELSDLLKAYGVGDPKNARQLVQQGLDDLAAFQAPSGGMRLWPSSQWVNDYLSVYALDLFAAAKEQGYHVDEKLSNDLRAYVKKIPNAEKFDYPYNDQEKMIVKTYAVSVLASLGVKDRGAFDNLYANRKNAPMEARVWLYRAARQLAVGRDKVQGLRDELTSRVRMEADSAYFSDKNVDDLGWVYGDNIATTADILGALVEDENPPDFLPKVVKYLMRAQKGGHWATTQNDLCVLFALNAYHQKYEKDDPNFRAVIKIQAKEMASETFKGKSLQVSTRSIPMEQLPEGKVPVDIVKTGKGRLYYAMRLAYAPVEDVPARDEGFMILRQVVPVEGAPSADPTLKAGQIYKVTLSVITPADRQYVVLDEPLPGGVEVVQTTFETESDTMRRVLELSHKDDKSHWWGGTFNHFEVHDDRVLLFAEQLDAGEHTFEYLIRAGYPGKFEQPSTKCEEMYSPEVFGTTNKQTVEIR